MTNPEAYAVWEKSQVWNGIEITIKFNVSGCGIITKLNHIELETKNKEKLPVTDTGYRSCFIHWQDIEPYGDAVGYVTAWLDDAAQSKAWQKHWAERQAALQQPDLFGELI